MNDKSCMYLYGKMALLRLTPVVYYISLYSNMFLWFNFWNILNVYILNPNTWIGIIKFGGHHATKLSIIYSNGSHIGFNYTHNSLIYWVWYIFLRHNLTKAIAICKALFELNDWMEASLHYFVYIIGYIIHIIMKQGV